MHYTLHLTNRCNMNCTYCYVDDREPDFMDFETARKAVELAVASRQEGSVGIIFFGGEPLIHKDLIYRIVGYCRQVKQETGCPFHFKVTTNGLLLDQEFLDFSQREHLFIALSHDGVREAHDRHRVDESGSGTFARLSEKIELLLSYRPYAPVMLVVNPDTVRYYCDSVQYLYAKGFKYLICSMNYAAPWTKDDLKVLEAEYHKLADFYRERTLAEDKFYLSPFEVKMSSHIHKDTFCRERCELGMRQVSVGMDGTLYPCVQFVGNREYAIGDVESGVDVARRYELYTVNEEEKAECRECAVRERCNHHCGCLNLQATGRIDRVSPVLCAHERILLPIADRLAERLYRKRSAMFIQKQYNDMFPLLSLIEDQKAE